MKVTIAPSIFTEYPKTNIGYLVAKISVQKSDPYVESLKSSINKKVKEMGIDSTNFVENPSIKGWREIYSQHFGVKPKTYRSSIEALLKRVVTGGKVWNISNVVDLYNCCSIMTLLPMGGYDLSKIEGNIYLRHGRESDTFYPLGTSEEIAVNKKQVVYADDEKILCWLWNHKDSRFSYIDENTQMAIFFIDSAFDDNREKLERALEYLSKQLGLIHCSTIYSGILNHNYPAAIFDNVF